MEQNYIQVNDYIYGYSPVVDEKEVKIKKVLYIIKDITQWNYGRYKLSLQNTENLRHMYKFNNEINPKLDDYRWGNTYYCTSDSDEFFLDFFKKEYKEKLRKEKLRKEQEERIRLIAIGEEKESAIKHIKDSIKNKGIDDVLCVPKISFNRYTENKKAKTFDTIRFTASLVGFNCVRKGAKITKNEIIDILAPYKKQLVDYALEYISNSKKFQKYNVPIGFLKIYGMIITNDQQLVIDFALKEI